MRQGSETRCPQTERMKPFYLVALVIVALGAVSIFTAGIGALMQGNFVLGALQLAVTCILCVVAIKLIREGKA